MIFFTIGTCIFCKASPFGVGLCLITLFLSSAHFQQYSVVISSAFIDRFYLAGFIGPQVFQDGDILDAWIAYGEMVEAYRLIAVSQ